jgi:anti-anti-sigma factor
MDSSVVRDRTLRLEGLVDVRSTAEVRAALYALLDTVRGDVYVDLSAVEAVDITALRVFAVADQVARRAGSRVVLIGCQPMVRRLLRISHLSRLLRTANWTGGVPEQGAAPEV